MMYRDKSLFSYADGCYSIMPSGLPERFYPQEESRKHIEKEYVICFDKGVSEDIKQRLIKDYKDYYVLKKSSGIYG